MRKIRLGFVGVGSMGQAAHLRNYATEGDCEVIACAEPKPKLRAAVQARYGIPRAYADHRELIAGEKLDGIVAIQPHAIHGLLVPDLLTAGVPVLTEKPIGSSIEIARKLVSASQASKGKLFIAYHKRSDPATAYAKRGIDELRASGEIGPLKYLRVCHANGDWAAEGFSQNISTDEPYPPVTWDVGPVGLDAAGLKEHNVLVNGYSHHMNLMRHLFGESYEVRYADPSGVVMAVTSDSGVPGVFERAPYGATIDYQEHAIACFGRGYVRIDLPAPLAFNRAGKVTIFKDPGNGVVPTTIEPTLPWVHAMRNQARNFIKACRGEATDLCSAEDACADIAAIDRYFELLMAVRAAAPAMQAVGEKA